MLAPIVWVLRQRLNSENIFKLLQWFLEGEMRVRNSSNGHDEGSAAKKRRVVGLPQIEETVREFLETICQKCGPKPGANSTRDSGSSNSSSSSRCSSSSSCSSTIGSLASCCSISSCCEIDGDEELDFEVSSSWNEILEY